MNIVLNTSDHFLIWRVCLHIPGVQEYSTAFIGQWGYVLTTSASKFCVWYLYHSCCTCISTSIYMFYSGKTTPEPIWLPVCVNKAGGERRAGPCGTTALWNPEVLPITDEESEIERSA